QARGAVPALLRQRAARTHSGPATHLSSAVGERDSTIFAPPEFSQHECEPVQQDSPVLPPADRLSTHPDETASTAHARRLLAASLRALLSVVALSHPVLSDQKDNP